MANRKGQQQPMRKGTGRQPGAPLSAALAGRAAPGLASAVKQGQASAGVKLADALSAGSGVAAAAKKSGVAGAATPLADMTAKPKPNPAAQRTYTTTGQLNENKDNAREGMSFATFTRDDRPGMVYHEYKDPKTGERHVFGLKAGKNSLGA